MQQTSAGLQATQMVIIGTRRFSACHDALEKPFRRPQVSEVFIFFTKGNQLVERLRGTSEKQA